MREFSRYGSNTHKQVYIYGGLDRGPTVLHRDFGLTWSVSGWLLTPFLGKLGTAGVERLRRRVADEITTTFASSYGMKVTLPEAVDPGDGEALRPHGDGRQGARHTAGVTARRSTVLALTVGAGLLAVWAAVDRSLRQRRRRP